MKLPAIESAEKYVGLYVVDLGDQCNVGYTAEEVACLLESESFAHVKVYRIHRARPDGTMELAGVSHETFQKESGMFFVCTTEPQAQREFEQLLECSQRQSPPCRTKLHLSQDAAGRYLVALIYPAEFEPEMGRWLADQEFDHLGHVDAGPSQVTQYNTQQVTLLKKEQLWPATSIPARPREELLEAVGMPLQR